MIDWLTQASADCAAPVKQWLTVEEQAQYVALKSDKRRHDWRLGRWAAKRLLQVTLRHRTGECPPLTALAIHNAPDGAPYATWDLGKHGEWGAVLSLSHTGDQAFCALSYEPIPLGADIEYVEPRAVEFVNDYFTQPEIALVMHAPSFARDQHITAIWSAKEAALKALRLGLTVDTRAITCHIQPMRHGPAAWMPFEIETASARIPRAPSLMGWWRTLGRYVLTLVAGRAQAEVSTPAMHAASVV